VTVSVFIDDLVGMVVIFFFVLGLCLPVRLASTQTVQGLVSDDSERRWIPEVRRDPRRPRLTGREELAPQAVNPLVADGEGGGEDECWLVDAFDYL